MNTRAASAVPPARRGGPTTAARGAAWTGFVLHQYPWSESSLILELFTREAGRVTAVAKGAKRPTSQYRSILRPFQRVQLGLSRVDPSDPEAIQTLRHAEWQGAREAVALVRGEALFRGFYLNELLLKLLPRHDAHPVLFDAYADTLLSLAQSHASDAAQGALRAFELTLLRELGWLADLSVTALTQQAIDIHQRYALRSQGGLVAVHEDQDAIMGLHWLRMNEALQERAHDELRLACEDPATAPLRGWLRRSIGEHIGARELRTRDVALGLQRFALSTRTASKA